MQNMDPYVVLQIGKQQKVTKACYGGGLKPKFDDSFVFDLLPSQEKEFLITCYDHDTMTPSDYIADRILNLSEFLTTGRGRKWYHLQRDNKYGGRILLEWNLADTPHYGTRLFNPNKKAQELRGSGYIVNNPVNQVIIPQNGLIGNGYQSIPQSLQISQNSINLNNNNQNPLRGSGYQPQGSLRGSGYQPVQSSQNVNPLRVSGHQVIQVIPQNQFVGVLGAPQQPGLRGSGYLVNNGGVVVAGHGQGYVGV